MFSIKRFNASSVSDEEGSAPVEFVMVGVLLVGLTLAIVQFALAVHVRNTVQDAASEGARWAALADSSLEAGVSRTNELIHAALGDGLDADVSAQWQTWAGHPAAVVTVTAPAPVIGLFGLGFTIEVAGHASREVL